MNSQALLHKIKIICPTFANFYRTPARLFIIGGIELSSKEGTTQSDPIGMTVYAIGIIPHLNEMLSILTMNDQMVAFAHDIAAAGKCESLRMWWDSIKIQGPLFG